MTCLDGLSCSQCYFLECSSCDGYLLSGCHACTNGQTAPGCCAANCRSCSSFFPCIICQISTYLYEGTCLIESPYGGLIPLASPVLVTIFDSPFAGSYGIFSTGSSSSTYQFFNNPDSNDPIPAKQRGLYFDGNSQLSSNLALPHIFSVGMLIKPSSPTSMNLIDNSGYMIIQPFNTVITLCMQQDSGSFSSESSSQLSPYLSWTFLSLSMAYSVPSTTLQVFINTQLVFTNTFIGVARTYSNNYYIGGYADTLVPGLSSYTGFLYALYMWNTPITDYSDYSSFTVCSPSGQSPCMWDCSFSEYLGTDSTCDSCLATCLLGCTGDQSCNLCQDLLCAVCASFTSECTECVANAVLVGKVCQCNSNTVASAVTCTVCDGSCSTCFSASVNGCLTCSDSEYLLCEGVCVSGCPDGFAVEGVECIAKDYVVMSVRLSGVMEYGSTQGVTIGSSSAGKDANDPKPLPGRGYYFASATAMLASSKLIFSIMSANLWVKIMGDGNILVKGSGFWTITAVGESVTTSVDLPVGSLSASITLSAFWEYYSAQFNIISPGLMQLTAFQGLVQQAQVTSSVIGLVTDVSSDIVLGDYSGSGFTGFLWSIGVYNCLDLEITDFLTAGCTGGCSQCPLEGVCPSECLLTFPPNDCTESCPTACEICITSTDCLVCYPTAILTTDQKCACPDRFVWDNGLNLCIFPCFPNCTE